MHVCMSCCRPLTTATAPAGTIEYVRFTLAHTRVAPNVRGVLAVAPVCMHADVTSTTQLGSIDRYDDVHSVHVARNT